MTDGDALLAAICAHPAEDTPRLEYADWLQENGRDERAEFIRVQCERARLPEPDELCIGSVTPAASWQEERLRTCRACSNLGALCPYHELEKRERELLYTSEDAHQDRLRIDWLKDMLPSAIESWQWDRGFIRRIWVKADHWLSFAELWRTILPLEHVSIVMFRPREHTQEKTHGRKRSCRLRGRLKWRRIPLAEAGNGDYARLFAAEWRGISFDLHPFVQELPAKVAMRGDGAISLTRSFVVYPSVTTPLFETPGLPKLGTPHPSDPAQVAQGMETERLTADGWRVVVTYGGRVG